MTSHNKIFRLAPEVSKKIKPLTRKSNVKPMISLGGAYLTVAIAIAMTIQISWWLYPIALILIGSTQRGFTNLLHEASHGILAKNKRLNYFAGTTLTGHLVFHFLASYKESHIENHHPSLGDAEKDPDYRFHLEMGLYDHENESAKTFFIKNILLSLLGFRTFSYLKYVIKDRLLFKPKNREEDTQFLKEKIQFYSLLTVVLVAAYYFNLWFFVFMFWFVPMFTTASSIGWLIELAEHYPLPESETNTLLLTRNRHGWAIENWIFGRYNDNYHLLHHLKPNIPHYNVVAAHKILLEDPAYKEWDDLWGGIFTRQSPERMTLFDYVSKYKDWIGRDASNKGKNYAEYVIEKAYIG